MMGIVDIETGIPFSLAMVVTVIQSKEPCGVGGRFKVDYIETMDESLSSQGGP
jgi:hypothetical protein